MKRLPAACQLDTRLRVAPATTVRQRKYIDLIENSLNELTSAFIDTLTRQYGSLTPAELRICHSIRQGLSTKEIAGLEHSSAATVSKHREHIRKKLGITNQRTNSVTF